jgi:hypothetical protein
VPLWGTLSDEMSGLSINKFTQRQSYITTVRLGVRQPSGVRYQFFFLLDIFFRQLRACYFVAPSLTRGRVCNLLLLLVLANAIPRNSRPYFIVPILETLPTWRDRSSYLYPPGTGWHRYTSGHWVPFPSPLTNRRAMVEVFYPASTLYIPQPGVPSPRIYIPQEPRIILLVTSARTTQKTCPQHFCYWIKWITLGARREHHFCVAYMSFT